MALSALGIAVAEEGEEEVSLFDLAFDFGIAVLPGDEGPAAREQAGFRPLRESDLAFVVVLMTDRLGAIDADQAPSSDVDIEPGRDVPRINFLSGLEQTFDQEGAAETETRPIEALRAALDRILNYVLTTITGETGGTWDLVAGAIDDAVRAVPSAVGWWSSPWIGDPPHDPCGGGAGHGCPRLGRRRRGWRR